MFAIAFCVSSLAIGRPTIEAQTWSRPIVLGLRCFVSPGGNNEVFRVRATQHASAPLCSWVVRVIILGPAPARRRATEGTSSPHDCRLGNLWRNGAAELSDSTRTHRTAVAAGTRISVVDIHQSNQSVSAVRSQALLAQPRLLCNVNQHRFI